MIQAERLALSFGDGDSIAYALRDVSFEIPERGFVGIMGPSGSGKSSLLYLLSGLKLPTSGEVRFGGKSLSSLSEAGRTALRRTHFGFVFQQPYLINYLTAFENIMLAALPEDKDATNYANTLLERMNILHLAHRTPAHLSGGERQRLIVARAMMNRPSVIFADEPTAALDHDNGGAVVAMLADYRSEGTSIVVTHDPEALVGADIIFYLRDGKLERIAYAGQDGSSIRTG